MRYRDALLSLLFPPACALCGNRAARDGLCEDCLEAFAAEAFLKCPRCGNPADRCSCGEDFARDLPSCSVPGSDSAAGGGRLYTLTFYIPENRKEEGGENRVTDAMILRLKEDGSFADFFAGELAREIGRLLDRRGEDPRKWTVTWCPRSPEKFMKTGFDQGEEISRRLAKRLGSRSEALLMRADLSEEQKSLGAEQRRQNARTSLGVRLKKLKPGMKILLVDDILTTGSTVRTSAELLYAAGAERVFPVLVAKTLPR
jgi:predicted amidophosphoribosyltransferase